MNYRLKMNYTSQKNILMK